MLSSLVPTTPIFNPEEAMPEARNSRNITKTQLLSMALLLIGSRCAAESVPLSDFVSPTPPPAKGCQLWCATHQAPWRVPNPSAKQKCKWPKNCGGCPQCLTPTPTTPPTKKPSRKQSLAPTQKPRIMSATDGSVSNEAITPTSHPIKYRIVNPTTRLKTSIIMSDPLVILLCAKSTMDAVTTELFQTTTTLVLSNITTTATSTTEETAVKIVEVAVEHQEMIETTTDDLEGLNLLSFQKLVGACNCRSEQEDSMQFLLLEVIMRGEVGSEDLLSSMPSFSLKEKVRNSLERDAEDYLTSLVNTSSFFNNVVQNDCSTINPISNNSVTSTFSDPLNIAAVIIGGLMGSLVMLCVSFVLCHFIERDNGNHSSSSCCIRKRGYRLEGCHIFSSFRSRLDSGISSEKDLPPPKPDVDIPATIATSDPMERTPYPQSICFTSQDSFSTLSFREYTIMKGMIMTESVNKELGVMRHQSF